MPPRCQLLPSTNRGRGRGRGGWSFDGSSNRNNNGWSEGTLWRADQTPAERMIRRSLPDCNEFQAPRQRHSAAQRFHPYERQQQQYQRAPIYPPAYPPPSLLGPFANPYTAYPHPDDEFDWNRRGGSGRPPLYRGGNGGRRLRRGYYH